MDEKIKNSIIDILLTAGYLTKKQAQEILSKEKTFYARLLKSRGKTISREKIFNTDISIVDIIDSLKLNLPGSDSEYLTEEVIMKEVAKHLGVPIITYLLRNELQCE